MSDISHFTELPGLVGFSIMALVLLAKRRDETGAVRLWVFALALIAAEGLARIVYRLETSLQVHRWVHAFALTPISLQALFSCTRQVGEWLSGSAQSCFLPFARCPFLRWRRPTGWI
ncbi:MAG: hypothetical protein PW792_11525 [Acidobacteriaceae bacterium]|nr:hypothetical protein [Acidobacteriaceae bacterium]